MAKLPLTRYDDPIEARVSTRGPIRTLKGEIGTRKAGTLLIVYTPGTRVQQGKNEYIVTDTKFHYHGDAPLGFTIVMRRAL